MKKMKSKESPAIVFVDDDYEDVYPMIKAIRNYRKDVVCDRVSSGDELFDYLGGLGENKSEVMKESPRLILMDINMPKQDGIEILKQLRNDPVCGCVSVIMFTTSDSQEDIRKAYKAGANSYVCKPRNADEMRRIAENICDFWIDLAEVPTVA